MREREIKRERGKEREKDTQIKTEAITCNLTVMN